MKRKAHGGRKNVWDLFTEDPVGKDSLTTEPAPRPKVTPIARPEVEPMPPFVDRSQPIAAPSVEVIRKGPGWAATLTEQTNALIDCYAECLDHARQHLLVKPEDVRALLISSFIALSNRGGRGRNAA